MFVLLVVLFLPPVSHWVSLATGEIAVPAAPGSQHRRRSSSCASPSSLLITGHNTFYTYIAPWAIDVGGVAPDGVAGLLFAYGAAGAIGLVLAGLLGDRFPRGLRHGRGSRA